MNETQYNDGAFRFDELEFGVDLQDYDWKHGKDPNTSLMATGKRTKERHTMRRASSEAALENVLDWHLQEGNSYHIISAGDIDSLSFLKMIVRQQPLEYCLVSTWCMAMTDAELLESYVRRGFIKRLDLYVGEIFQRQYEGVYNFCASKIARRFGGRVCVFRNHSKVMVGFGRNFDFAIEGSANVDTNPRTEQTCITASRDLALFYKQFYDGIISFNRDFDEWKPYKI